MTAWLNRESRRKIIVLAISAAALILSLCGVRVWKIDTAWVAILLCGVPIVFGAVSALIKEFDIKADVLVSIALIASVVIGEYFAAAEIAFIMQIGALLEELTVAKAKSGVEKLSSFSPVTARVISDGNEKVIPAEQVKVGDIVLVNPGEIIPVDGVIINGSTTIDQSILTGESMPVDKAAGSEVFSGTVNRFGSFEMRAEKECTDSSIQRMVKIVQAIDTDKSPVVNITDKWATAIVAAALTVAVITFLISHEILRAVTVLCVFCPCSLILATPTAIMAAVGNASNNGALVKDGGALERLSKIKRVVFDKTGTLTYGNPQVTDVVSIDENYTDDELFELAACAEARSEHPLGKAITASFYEKNKKMASQTEDFSIVPGKGVIAHVDGRKIEIGNFGGEKLATVIDRLSKQGKTVSGIYIDGREAGCIALSDTMRSGISEIVTKIKNYGIVPTLLTGDNAAAAAVVAENAGIVTYKAECMPEDKIKTIEKWQRDSIPVCMVGDGVNDAPSLKAASVGIAMGGIGSDIAIDAADIALVHDDISRLPHLIGLAKRMMTTIKLNITFSMSLNLAATVLAVIGSINPIIGALVHNGGSVLVILNSVLLLRWKKK